MTCSEALAEYDATIGESTGSAKVLVPPFGDVLPAMSPAVEMYREMVETPADKIDSSFKTRMLAMEVMLGPMPYYVDDVRRKCADQPASLFLDIAFPSEVEEVEAASQVPASPPQGNVD